MATAASFSTSFWSPPAYGDDATTNELFAKAVPKFDKGLETLHRKLTQAKQENDEILKFLEERVSIEENYGAKLQDLGALGALGVLQSSAFQKDEGAGLKRSFASVKQECSALGAGHKASAQGMRETVINPLKSQLEAYRKTINAGRGTMEIKIKQFDHMLQQVEQTRRAYVQKCMEADKTEEAAANAAPLGKIEQYDQNETNDADMPSASQPTQAAINDAKQHHIGTKMFSIADMTLLSKRMFDGIPRREHKTPLLGTYHNVSSGEDIGRWISDHRDEFVEEGDSLNVEEVGQQFAYGGYLRLITGRGNKFFNNSQSLYQWKLAGEQANADSAKHGLFDRLSSLTSGSGHSSGTISYKKAREDADAADSNYRKAVITAEDMRMHLEEQLFAHYDEMEAAERMRIQAIKDAFINLAGSMSNTLPASKAICDRLLMFQEALVPDNEVQYIVEQYRTGSFAPRPILYESFYHGVVNEQIFGVPLDDAVRADRVSVPVFVTACLKEIESKASTAKAEDVTSFWTTPISLELAHKLRRTLNVTDRSNLEAQLKPLEPTQVAGILRLYFMELPECLLTFELYDPLKSLYTSLEAESEEVRLTALGRLIATLPSPNFKTLQALIVHLITLYRDNLKADATFAEKLFSSLGPILLRPRVESLLTFRDRHPLRLLRDLLTYDTISDEKVMTAHEDNAKRRNSAPLKVSMEQLQAAQGLTSPGGVVNTPTDHVLDSPGNKKENRKSLLFSYMKPPHLPDFETARKSVSQIFGFMQRPSSLATPDSASSLTESENSIPSSKLSASASVPVGMSMSTIISSPKVEQAELLVNKTSITQQDKCEKNDEKIDDRNQDAISNEHLDDKDLSKPGFRDDKTEDLDDLISQSTKQSDLGSKLKSTSPDIDRRGESYEDEDVDDDVDVDDPFFQD